MSARRGEVWLVDLDPVAGHEQAGRRPALVLSVDAFNASRAELVTVLPITSKPRPNNPFRVEVRPPEGGLSVPSYVIGEQTRTVSTHRLGKLLGALSGATMAKVADVVRVVLGL
ncbi:MAG: type II toxin-antitoxin system PemK/MazF family toxin [Myxococcales bacterium]|nr:type II toxin-antitoxin system PemK/MazF family toxin [Myxococcales bacterium]